MFNNLIFTYRSIQLKKMLIFFGCHAVVGNPVREWILWTTVGPWYLTALECPRTNLIEIRLNIRDSKLLFCVKKRFFAVKTVIYISEKGHLQRFKSCWEHSICHIGEHHNFAKK